MFPKPSFAVFFAVLLTMASPQAGTISEDEIQLVARPYTPPSLRTFRVRTNLVLVPVVVRDAKGKPVAGLGQRDFQIFDNGKQQTISAFSVENSPRVPSNTPRPGVPPRPKSQTADTPAAFPRPQFVALFFDDVNSRPGDLIAARVAAEKWIREALPQADRVGIFTSSFTVSLEFTNDKDTLLASLAKIESRARVTDEGPGACPPMSPWQAHLIINGHDNQALELGIGEGMTLGCLSPPAKRGASESREIQAGVVKNRAEAVLSLAEQYSLDTLTRLSRVIRYLARMPGDRMLLLASSGFFTRSPQAGSRQDRLIDDALRGGIVINSLDAKGLTAEPPQGRMIFSFADNDPSRPIPRNDLMIYADTLRIQQREANNDPMAVLAEGTGGRFFHNNNDLNRGLRELVATPEVSYLLGFSPVTAKPDGRFHELKVKLVTPRGSTLQARRGYFAPTPADLAREIVLTRFDSEVLATGTFAGFVAHVTTEPGKLDSGEPVLKLAIFLDVHGLYFARRGDRSVSELRCVFALFDAQGNYLVGREAVIDLALKAETLARLAPTGLYQHLTLEAPSGSYRLRAVLQEQAQGQMATLNQQVVIP